MQRYFKAHCLETWENYSQVRKENCLHGCCISHERRREEGRFSLYMGVIKASLCNSVNQLHSYLYTPCATLYTVTSFDFSIKWCIKTKVVYVSQKGGFVRHIAAHCA